MANQPETNSFDAGVYQIEVADPVDGGVGSHTNAPLLNLANRTRWLYNQVASILTTLMSTAGLNSPALTGTPTAPTPAPGDNSTAIATTAFVDHAIGYDVLVNCAGNSNIVLTAAQYGCGIITLSGVLTGNIAVIFPSQDGRWIVNNGTTGAFTVTCRTASGTGIAIIQGLGATLFGDGTNIYRAERDVSNAQGSTPAAGDNSANLATTAFVAANALLQSNNGSDIGNLATFLGNLGFGAGSGYFKIPNPSNLSNPLIVQYGTGTAPSNPGLTYSVQAISWPIEFPNACFGAVGVAQGNADSVHGYLPTCGTGGAPTQSGATFHLDIEGGNSGSGAGATFNQSVPFFYIALGY